jgi:3-oxoacyl-[acyl-carrier-protein] synthase II
MNSRVVVTGLGVVGRLGFEWQDFWAALLAGQSAIVPWQPENIEDFPVRYAAPVDNAQFASYFSAQLSAQPPMERRSQFGLMAAHQAMNDAGLLGKTGLNMGVAVGSGIPERYTPDMLLAMGDGGPDWQTLYAKREQLNPAMRSGNDQLAALIARAHGANGPVQNFSTACAGAAHA